MLRLSNALKAVMPGLSMENIRQLQNSFNHLIISGWYSAHPPELQAAIYEKPEFSTWKRDVVQDIINSLYYILKGMMAEGN